MKKVIIASLVLGVFALVGYLVLPFLTNQVEAGAKNADYFEWTWEGEKSAHFMKTGSGIVQGWTYDHPKYGDARFQYKPLSKFKNAVSCDDDAVFENTSWNPQNLFNVMDTEYEDGYWDIFMQGERYLFCVYPMD